MSGCPSDVNVLLTSSEQRRNWAGKLKQVFLASKTWKQARCPSCYRQGSIPCPDPIPGSSASPSPVSLWKCPDLHWRYFKKTLNIHTIPQVCYLTIAGDKTVGRVGMSMAGRWIMLRKISLTFPIKPPNPPKKAVSTRFCTIKKIVSLG